MYKIYIYIYTHICTSVHYLPVWRFRELPFVLLRIVLCPFVWRFRAFLILKRCNLFCRLTISCVFVFLYVYTICSFDDFVRFLFVEECKLSFRLTNIHTLYSLFRIAPNTFDFCFRVNRPTWQSYGLYWLYIGPGLRKQDVGNILEWWLIG